MFKQKLSVYSLKALKILEIGSRSALRNETLADRVVELRNHIVRNRYFNFDPKLSLFRKVNLMTQTGCNYSCPFCAVNKKGIDLPEGRIEKNLFLKICDELHELNFSGTIAMHVNNEPLLDERITDFISIARERCRKSTIYFATNGSKLDSRVIRELFEKGISHIIVNDYTPENRIIKRIREMNLPHEIANRLVIRDRSWKEDQSTGLSSRTGNVPGFECPQAPLELFCTYPFKEIFIGPDGRVPLCCYDVKFVEIKGDCSKDSLFDIWCNDKYNAIREKLLNFDRSGIVCSKCDHKGLRF